jgi:hypothetical protein
VALLLSPQDQNQNLTAGEKDSGPGAGAGERRGGTTLLARCGGGQRARAQAGVAVWAVRGWGTSERSGCAPYPRVSFFWSFFFYLLRTLFLRV